MIVSKDEFLLSRSWRTYFLLSRSYWTYLDMFQDRFHLFDNILLQH